MSVQTDIFNLFLNYSEGPKKGVHRPGVKVAEIMWLTSCLVQKVTGVTTVGSTGLLGTMIFV